MKTIKSILAGLIILIASVATSNAAVKMGGPSQNDVLNMYISAITTGKTTDLDKFLDNGLQYNVHVGEKTNTLSKEQLVDYLKNATIIDAPQNTVVTVVEQDDNVVKMKVELKYEGFTRTDVVTISKFFGWKITNIDSTSK
jgi:methyl coenzyme M reductase beta subunit